MQAKSFRQQQILFKRQFPISVDTYFFDNTQPCFIILPAIGVPIEKYQNLIHELKQRQINIIVADYPGCGRNYPQVSAQFDYGYQDVIQDFIPQLLALAQQYSQQRPVLFGHSLGGQMATLAATQHDVKVIGIATAHIGLKYWNFKTQLTLIKGLMAIKALTLRYGYLPGFKIGFGHIEAKTLMRDWSKALLSNNYRHVIETEQAVDRPALFIQLHQDTWAPMSATLGLSKFFQSPQIEVLDLSRSVPGNQHSIWLKQPKQIVDACIKWLELRSEPTVALIDS